MVNELHVKTSVDEVEVGRAGDVHGGAELASDEALVDAHVGGVLRRVRKDDLEEGKRESATEQKPKDKRRRSSPVHG